MSISRDLGTERIAEVRGARIAYREAGPQDGLVVLFLHGALVNGDLWRAVVPPLSSAGYRCVTPDWPLGSHRRPLARGAERTPRGLADLVVAFADALGLDRPTLVANDTGGAIAQILVAAHPERLGSLVLTSCDAFENFLPPRYRYLSIVARSHAALRLLGRTLPFKPAQRSPIAFGPLVRRAFPAEIAGSYFDPIATVPGIAEDAAAFLRAVDRRLTLEAAPKLRSFRQPALIAWGADDRIFPQAHGRRLAELLPDAVYTEIAGARAFVPEDAPEPLAQALLDHLARIAPPLRRAVGGRRSL